MSRKSASIRSFSSGAKICKKLAQPMRLPTPKERPVRNSKELGAMKSLTERPDGASQSHEKRNGSCSSMCSIPCSSRSRSMPFMGSAATPRRLKLFRMSVSMRSSLGFAAFSPSASTPKVRYLVLMRPLLPRASWFWSIWVYSRRMLSKSSPCGEMVMCLA